MDNVDAIETSTGCKNCKSSCKRSHRNSRGTDDSGLVDNIREKLISRKLLVFATATALMVSSNLDSNTWGLIAMCYIGGQTAIDFAKTWKGP